MCLGTEGRVCVLRACLSLIAVLCTEGHVCTLRGCLYTKGHVCTLRGVYALRGVSVHSGVYLHTEGCDSALRDVTVH